MQFFTQFVIYNNMEFKDNIKQLHNDYFKTLESYYKTNRLILKMVLEKAIYKYFSNIDLAFRMCALNKFSDKRIDKLYYKDIEKGIDLLRRRGVSCMYVAEHIKDTIQKIENKPNNVDFVNKLKQINNDLYALADESIKRSDKWAIQCDLKLFKDGKFNIDDYKTSK